MSRLLLQARKLASILTVSLWRKALMQHRVAAGVEHITVLRQLGACRTVVDIGANRGQFALAARAAFADAQIYSFEPLSAPASGYRATLASDVRVCLLEAAVGPEKGEADIHLSERDDSSSLLPITGRQDELFPGTAEIGRGRISVVRLADVLSAEEIVAPSLLKLDVQGFELQALAGSEDLLPLFDWVYVECSFVELYAGQAFADEVIAWLRERGFRLTGVFNMSYDRAGRAIQADFLFKKS
ncbi:methyltransferase FkbM [Thioalkalivibrio sulfidiphilus HL-EbGr7]|uniref:Methyltransferase FkbM n=1 Tax=Thioalkalivibrio sulfidiphilus (strain HL-EbGR7) TaxID=396588 RepID=B8GTT1_THISH|nr:FkbM family methyltransferase [Thioalkalivibrio sulfidiphilus]ACL73175.1 methyltransferase FkbM [Thioalkalivibrio sulfidiphilus HL-EbGr7]